MSILWLRRFLQRCIISAIIAFNIRAIDSLCTGGYKIVGMNTAIASFAGRVGGPVYVPGDAAYAPEIAPINYSWRSECKHSMNMTD
jgi:hypothetical protein